MAMRRRSAAPSRSTRISRATGPKRYSIIDLPTIQLTATGDSMKGMRNTTRQNFRATISALSSRARPKAMAYSTSTIKHVEDHVAERVPEIGVVPELDQVVDAVEFAAVQRGEVPVGEGDRDAEQRREDHDRDGEQRGRQDEQRAHSCFAADQHHAAAERDRPDDIGVERRPPVGEAELDRAGRVEDLQEHDRAPNRPRRPR